ncbi:MAG: YitT family protein [Candidatus Moeniiplasma glomeromycotorum]|nr:YitT family protein [Candidatus Moeniiplasma glomeromycotorum]MCE8168074.1 YitT family protein [Candidatus Moeniiplasma glomeromycotorum]MCE8169617.1 YitT family protein [Candidatus Moeniiplasma glomeromycotorum]
MNPKKKKKLTSQPDFSSKDYNIFEKYQAFIRKLHTETTLKKPTRKERFFRYLSRLVFVLVGSFFTTLAFYFLIDPNGIYNSGFNGLLQACSKLIVGHGKLSWAKYYLLYYGLGLLTNLLFILFLRLFFKAKLEIISTSIFYVLSQIAWTQIFSFFKLRESIFSRFNPTSWQGLTNQSQLSFTLPYYIVIAIVAAIVYTYGTSLIYQAQSTKGGLDIFIAHFSAQKKKISISAFMKIFGGVILFSITLVNFFWIEDNSRMKESSLEKEIQENENLATNPKIKDKKLKVIVEEWKKDMERANLLEKENQLKESFAIRGEFINQSLTSLFRNKAEETQIEKYPQEIEYYLKKNEEKISLMETELDKLSNSTENLTPQDYQRKINLSKRKEKISKEQERKLWQRYLIYTTNNERLWATVVYIFLTSFLMSQIFPRDKLILLNIYASNQEKLTQGLNLLKKYPTYHYTIHKKRTNAEEETIYVIESYLSKWDYYLLFPYLKQIGIIYTHETSQQY